ARASGSQGLPGSTFPGPPLAGERGAPGPRQGSAGIGPAVGVAVGVSRGIPATFHVLAPGLCPGTHCDRGSASNPTASGWLFPQQLRNELREGFVRYREGDLLSGLAGAALGLIAFEAHLGHSREANLEIAYALLGSLCRDSASQ